MPLGPINCTWDLLSSNRRDCFQQTLCAFLKETIQPLHAGVSRWEIRQDLNFSLLFSSFSLYKTISFTFCENSWSQHYHTFKDREYESVCAVNPIWMIIAAHSSNTNQIKPWDMKKCCLTQRLRQCGCWTAVENIMNLILQVHYSCKRPVAAPITLWAGLLVKRSTSVAGCSKPHRQRPVQGNIQHIKPERPVGLTPEPRDAVSSLLRARGWRHGQRRRSKGTSLHVWILFGLWFIEMRFYFSTAGTVLTKWAVAAQKVATANWVCVLYGQGGRFSV